MLKFGDICLLTETEVVNHSLRLENGLLPTLKLDA